MLCISGCNSMNFGLTAKDEGENYKTTYVLGFAILREKTDENKVVTVNDDNVLGLFYNTDQQKFGIGYYSGVYTKVLKVDENTILEIKRNMFGKLEINTYIMKKPDKEYDDSFYIDSRNRFGCTKIAR